MSSSQPKTLQLELTGLSHGGDAIGKHDGLVVFVPYGIPGDTAEVKISEKKKSFARGTISRIIEASPDRVVPPCQYFERCGGCHWQHIDYPAQLHFKQQIVKDTLTRIGSFVNPVVYPTVANDKPWRYRSHLTFHSTKQGQLGLVSIDNKNIIPVEDCLIARPEIIKLLQAKNNMAAQNFKHERVRIQVGADSVPHKFSLPEQEAFIRSSEGPATIYTVLGHSFRCSPGSFFQADPDQAGKLVEIVLGKLGLQGKEQVLDLFSGVGLFTAFIAEQAAQVTSVELSSLAVEDAELNLATFENVTLIEGGIREALISDAIPPSLPVDSIVVDPPRTGIRPDDLEVIVARLPTKIVYVSCDPATLARDAKFLVKNGFMLEDVQPIDMFPQTYHIEAVATFLRS